MQANNSKFLIVISGLIITANIAAAIMANKILELNVLQYHFSILFGILPFCISVMLLNIFTNQYGTINLKRLIIAVVVCRLFLALGFYIMSNNIAALGLQYSQLDEFNSITHALLAGTVASIIGFFITGIIFNKLYTYYNGKHLWLRCIVATAIGEFIYSLVSNTIFFIHNLNLHSILMLSFNNYGFKLIFEIVTLPLTYLLVYIITKSDNQVVT